MKINKVVNWNNTSLAEQIVGIIPTNQTTNIFSQRKAIFKN